MMKKYDERETLFSRVSLEKKSNEYREFYKKNPTYRKKDDALRGISFRRKIRKSEEFKDIFLPLTGNNKLMTSGIFNAARSFKVSNKRQELPKSFAKNIKEIAKYYGATDVGIAKLTDANYYSHFAGLNENVGIKGNYGEPIKPSYKTAIIFTRKMDLEMMNRAPHYEELMTTEDAYLHVALTGARLEMYLKSLGYKSESVNGEYYLTPLVPIALDAGLGQIGMCNHIVTKEHGNNVRLGAVFTTMELEYDNEIDYGLHDFCKKCALCLMNCPTKAITHLQREVNGRIFYKFDDNKCYEGWTKMGTDCGTCIQACPLTQGVDLSKLDKMKDNPELMEEIMEEHYEKYGRRNYTPHDLDIVKLDKDE